MKYSFPVVVELEVSGELTHSELNKIKKIVVDQAEFFIHDSDMTSDSVQARISVDLKSIHIVSVGE